MFHCLLLLYMSVRHWWYWYLGTWAIISWNQVTLPTLPTLCSKCWTVECLSKGLHKRLEMVEVWGSLHTCLNVLFSTLTTLFCISSLVTSQILPLQQLYCHWYHLLPWNCMDQQSVHWLTCASHRHTDVYQKSVCVHAHACMHVCGYMLTCICFTQTYWCVQWLLQACHRKLSCWGWIGRFDNTMYYSTKYGTWCVMYRSLNCSGCVGCCLRSGLML